MGERGSVRVFAFELGRTDGSVRLDAVLVRQAFHATRLDEQATRVLARAVCVAEAPDAAEGVGVAHLARDAAALPWRALDASLRCNVTRGPRCRARLRAHAFDAPAERDIAGLERAHAITRDEALDAHAMLAVTHQLSGADGGLCLGITGEHTISAPRVAKQHGFPTAARGVSHAALTGRRFTAGLRAPLGHGGGAGATPTANVTAAAGSRAAVARRRHVIEQVDVLGLARDPTERGEQRPRRHGGSELHGRPARISAASRSA
jgi:hypothetical protein